MAMTGILDQGSFFASEHRATIPSLVYLLKADPMLLDEIARSNKCHEVYRQLIDSLKLAYNHEALRLSGVHSGSINGLKINSSIGFWPALWHRSFLRSADVFPYLKERAQGLLPDPTPHGPSPTAESGSKKAHQEMNFWEEFAGIPPQELLDALLMADDRRIFVTSLNLTSGLLNEDDLPRIRESLQSKGVFSDPFLSLLLVGRYMAGAGGTSNNSGSQIHNSSSGNGFSSATGADKASSADLEKGSRAPSVSMRREFFNVAFRGLKPRHENASPPPTEDDLFWSTLLSMWQQPRENQLPIIAQMIRRTGGLPVICYLNTLGRCRGLDQAALKVLDYVRSDQEDEMRAVIGALAGIDTARSLQELIAAITRPNMTRTLQLEALTLLKQHDLSHVQPHLRSAFADLGHPTDAAGIEVRDLLVTLLTTNSPAGSIKNFDLPGGPQETVTWDQTFDQKLASMIQGYRELSSEVKRALRTSLFFHMQVEQKGTSGLIDLSPIVDMQYKALELLFRESFEDHCSKLINRGTLQRKLDIIGYARPIPQAMDQFENYICSLPVVREIPFFSKFKLRKMLRAICQFRPGRRFTLDGLKAFALFFLCFARKECQYSLNQLLELGFADDKSLFNFAALLHTFQDLRNRAAHEGLHPEASSDIDRLWLQTAEIIQYHNKVYQFIASHAGMSLQRGSDYSGERLPSNPKIVKKVS